MSQQYKNSEIIRRVIRKLKPWRKQILLSNAFIILASLLAVFSIIAAFPFLELVFNPQTELIQKDYQLKSELELSGSESVSKRNVGWLDEIIQEVESYIYQQKITIKERIFNNPVSSLYSLIMIILGATFLRILLLSIVNLILSRLETKFIQKI